MSDRGPARRPRGTPAGGQFAARTRPEAEVDLGPPPASTAGETHIAWTDDPDRIWDAIERGDETTSFLVAANPHLDADQVAALLEPDRDDVVRWNCARTHPELAGQIVANDPDPIVKIWATHPRAGLTSEELAEVYADPKVHLLHMLMTGQDPEGERRLERMAAGLG